MGTAERCAMHPTHLEVEDTLRGEKWFDYRHLSPEQATDLFLEQYRAMCREFHGKIIDYDDASSINPLPHVTEQEWVCLWLARQAADSICCRYEFYLRSAFWRFVKIGFTELPRPNQLYAEELILDVRDEWEEVSRALLQCAKHPRFFADAWTAHPDQVAYYEYLIGQVKKRPNPHLGLARLVYQDRILPEEIAGQVFGAELLNKARLFHTTSR